MTRTIRAKMGENRILLEDRVVNLGYQSTPHMILYHFNLGFPVLDEHARVIAPSKRATPRDSDAEEGTIDWQRMQPPTLGYTAQVFFHEMEADSDGFVTAAVVNESKLDGSLKGVSIRYSPSELPCFTQWKMMDCGTYVLGMEPGNAHVMGRDIERQEGRLQFLEPDEERRYHLEIGVITQQGEIAELEAMTGQSR